MIKCCHICQAMGKLSQNIPQYPLQTIKLPEEPFHKIIIGIVDPKLGNGTKHLHCFVSNRKYTLKPFHITAKTIESILT